MVIMMSTPNSDLREIHSYTERTFFWGGRGAGGNAQECWGTGQKDSSVLTFQSQKSNNMPKTEKQAAAIYIYYLARRNTQSANESDISRERGQTGWGLTNSVHLAVSLNYAHV